MTFDLRSPHVKERRSQATLVLRLFLLVSLVINTSPVAEAETASVVQVWDIITTIGNTALGEACPGCGELLAVEQSLPKIGLCLLAWHAKATQDQIYQQDLLGPNPTDFQNEPRWNALESFKQTVGNACGHLDAPSFTSSAGGARDPNDKAGSTGAGSAQYISGRSPLRYAIYFSNEISASLPAQTVKISDQLDATSEDLSSFGLGPIALSGNLLTPAPGLTNFASTVDLRPASNLLVAVNATLNTSTGLVSWTFQSLDPSTGQPPTDPTVGFFPPGATGSVFFTVMSKSGVATNTQIRNQASIVFDNNTPMATQTWLNTIDNTPPVSRVSALPTSENSASFIVQWSGTDVGVGIQDYTIYLSDNGAPYTAFQTDTSSTSATLSGQAGHTYTFYSVARDLVGNVETKSPTAEATTTVLSSLAPAFTSLASATFQVGVSGSFTVLTSGVPAASLVETGTLPAGITFVDNGNGTGTFSGTPVTSGAYPLTLTGQNGIAPNATQVFVLSVDQLPAITSAASAVFQSGTASLFSITTSGFPNPAITETGALPAGVTFTDNGNGTATLAGTPTTGGVFNLTVTAANGVTPNATQPFTLTVNQAPAFTSVGTATFQVGAAGSFTVTTNGFPIAVVTETGGLPAGLTFLDNGNGTATLAGTPTGSGVYAVTLNASSSSGAAAPQTFTISVDQIPSITSVSAVTFLAGTASSFTVMSTAFPAAGVSETGALPAGLTFVNNGNGTALLAGTPTVGGVFPVTINANNAVGTATQTFTITVNQTPAITTVNATTFLLSTAGSFTVSSVGFPVATLSETGALPTGVSFVNNGNGTATLGGTPTASGVFNISVSANNSIGTANQAFTLTVDQTPIFSSVNSASFQAGTAGSFTVLTSGFPTPTLAESSALPTGVSFVDNHNGTGTLSGMAASSGTFNLLFTATNGIGTSTQNFVLTVTGAVAQINISPASINFGNVYLISLESQNVRLKNTGTTAITLGKPSISVSSGTDKDYGLVNQCPATLNPGQSCTITVGYVADDVETSLATLNIMDSATGSPQQVSLSANVINPIAGFNPLILSFGTLKVGTSAAKTETLKNIGTTPLNISSIAVTGPNAADFTATPNCPSSLTPGASCAVSVSFMPSAKGTRSAGLSVTDNARTKTQTIPLVGNGN